MYQKKRNVLSIIFKMGGPCYIKKDGSFAVAPASTDNFQVAPFEYKGVQYYSCEQAYQAYKFQVDSPEHEAIRSLVPDTKNNETDESHGMRCWSLGQSVSGVTAFRGDHECTKVNIMYEVNKAKYDQYPELQLALLQTGNDEIVGAPSTSWKFHGILHKWSFWNGLIQMRIREELKNPADRNLGKLEDIMKQFEEYEKMPPAIHNQQAALLARMIACGFKMPWVCTPCGFDNSSYPSICEQCDSINPDYAPALASANGR